MDIVIRKLEKSDIHNGFLDCLTPLFPVELGAEEAEEIYERIADNPAYCILVAEEDGMIVGAATLLIEQKFILKGARFGYLEDMSVRADRQGQGIGKLLVKAVIEEAQKADCLNVRLDCNASTKPFYEKSDFAHKSGVFRMQLNLRNANLK